MQVTVDLVKQPGRTLGFSIAGGRGSTPAYEDVDEVLYVMFNVYSQSYTLGLIIEHVHLPTWGLQAAFLF